MFWASVLLLFVEVFAIRWLGIELPIIRAFPNLIVIVFLIGSSAGLSNPEQVNRPVWLILAVSILLSAMIFAVPLNLMGFSLRLDQSDAIVKLLAALSVLMTAIICILIIAVNVGRKLGVEISKLPALQGYSINLLGSIAGVVMFALIVCLSMPPPVWIGILGLISWLLVRRNSVIIATVIFMALSLTTGLQSRWSPYSKLDIIPLAHAADSILGPGNYVVNSNNYYFHFAVRILQMDAANSEKLKSESAVSPQLATVAHYYTWLKLPFTYSPEHKRVLILGGGSGNDVAFAMKNGAESVDVVEIDPIIASFGKTLHPDKPYLIPGVTLHVEDARTFLRYSKNKYDLIEFAYLDPGSTLQTASFIRVDNFVYTVESIKAALSHLNNNGVATISFATGPRNFITQRLYQIVKSAQNGKAPVGLVDDGWESVLLFFGPGADNIKFDHVSLRPLRPWPLATDETNTRPATDDWPFLYLNSSTNGLVLYIAVLVVAVLLPALILARAKKGPISGAAWGNMFFLGQAFMLVETKSITQLSLLFGATWLVTSVVTVAVLMLAWFANWIVAKRAKSIPLLACYFGVIIALVIDYLFSVPATTSAHFYLVAGIATLFNCLPILFGGLIFSSCFKNASSPSMYLAANLLGVAVGGLTENLCIITGIKSCVLVAMVLYAMSYFALMAGTKSQNQETVQE